VYSLKVNVIPTNKIINELEIFINYISYSSFICRAFNCFIYSMLGILRTKNLHHIFF